jgi:hypothetical protein
MALAAGTSLSNLPHSSMGLLEVIMVERFLITAHNDLQEDFTAFLRQHLQPHVALPTGYPPLIPF